MSSWKKHLRPAFYALRGLFLYGHRKACGVCGGRFRRFLPKGEPARPEALCPRCLSLERHRLLWPVLRGFLTPTGAGAAARRPLSLLHFGPEESLRDRIPCLGVRPYVTADIAVEERPATLATDITRTGIKSGAFDRVLCCHVLEHIPDDAAALRELRRVLKPGGAALLQVPLGGGETDEDLAVTDPAERTRRFGQHDHVRLYGRDDFVKRVTTAGFRVDIVRGVAGLSARDIERQGLLSGGEGDDLLFLAWREEAEGATA